MIPRTLLALVLGILPLAAAAPGSALKPPRALAHLSEQLKLTETQLPQLQAIQARHAEAAKGLKQEEATARKAFQTALHNPETPVPQLRTLHQALQDKAFERLLDRRALDGEVRAILTPEQRQEWDKLLAYRQGMKRGRRGHGKGL